MQMLAGIESATAHGFIQRHSLSYPPIFPYRTEEHAPVQEAYSSPRFRESRSHMMADLLFYGAFQHEMAKSLALEYLVELALQYFLRDHGFKIQTAPQTLELSDSTQKGVDLLITDASDVVLLGVDVKLRRGHSSYNRDGYGWNQNLRTPYIYLSLGNLAISTREKEAISAVEWLTNYVVPYIGSSGKIPHIDTFRIYLLERIERSLFGLIERLREPEMYTNSFGLPTGDPSQENYMILEEKLLITHSLFAEIRQSL